MTWKWVLAPIVVGVVGGLVLAWLGSTPSTGYAVF